MPIERSTYKDHVIKYIYDGMRENRYNPGEKILESHLAKELGISRAPIREALADLVRSGLLEYRPQIGNFVAAMSPQEIIDSYVARGVLEGFAVAQEIGNFSDDDLQRLEEMTEKMATVLTAPGRTRSYSRTFVKGWKIGENVASGSSYSL